MRQLSLATEFGLFTSANDAARNFQKKNNELFFMGMEFDFDAWAALATNAPSSFEAARREALEAMIDAAIGQEHLRRMQWRIDAERRRAKTPLKACLVLSDLMWSSFREFQDALNDLLEDRGDGLFESRAR